MPERGRWLRLVLGAALAVLALVQVQQFARTVQGQARLRARVLERVEAPLRAVRSSLAGALSPGGPAAWGRAAALALAVHPQAEVELFGAQGRSLLARPGPAPVVHRPEEKQLQALRAGSLLTVGPVAGEGSRLLTYAAFRSGADDVLLRIAVPTPELVEDLRERRQLLLGHVLVLLALAVAAVLALAPGKSRPLEAPPRALDAYVEAMSRLRAHEQVETDRHTVERQRLEERIRDAEPMARAGELTAGVVHEVRNGLGTIVGYARLIEQGDVTPEAREAAQRIREECATLETVVRRFMEFVKEERLARESFDLQRMLSRVVSRESSRAGAPVSLGGDDGVTVVADEEMLERAFENLVRNAREAAGGAGHVWVEARREGDRVAVTVADDGPGLSPSQRDALRPFHTTKAGGLGLGLPIAVKIVRLHEGELTLAARAPRGLLVTVRLPAAPRPAAG